MTVPQQQSVNVAVADAPYVGLGRWQNVRRRLKAYPWLPALICAVVLLIVGQIVSPGYAGWNNINQILAGSAILAIAACGQSLVMVSGNFGIDLSVGEVMSLTAVAGYMVMKGGTHDLPFGIIVALAVGAAIGLINGALVAFVRLPALVVTLGTLVIAEGAVQVLAQSGQPAGSIPTPLADLTTSSAGGIKYVTFLGIVIVAGLVLFIKFSRYGRTLFLVGSNREAARLSGLPVKRIVVTTFILAGMCSGFAGLLLLSYAGSADLDLGGPYLLLAIAATVIGGTSLAGGEGSLIGAATGAIAFEVINTVMLTVGASDAVRQMVVGLLLMILLAFNVRIPKLRA